MMTKYTCRIISLLTLSFIYLVALPVHAEHFSTTRQVVYELQIVEVVTMQHQHISLDEMKTERLIDPTNPELQIIYQADMLKMIGAHPLSSLSTLNNKQSTTSLTAMHPGVIVAVGETSRITLIEEGYSTRQIIPPHGGSMQLSLSPIQVAEHNKQVLTQINLETSTNTQVNTEVWLTSEFTQPIALLYQQASSSQNRSFQTASASNERCYVLYIRAITMSELPSISTLKIGSLAGLSDIVWPEPDPLVKENHVKLLLSLDPLGPDNINLRWWLQDHLFFEILARPINTPKYLIGLSKSLFNQGLNVGIQIIHTPDSDSSVALGVSDRVEISPNTALSAGYYPLAYCTKTGYSFQNYWWAQAEWRYSRLLVTFHYEQDKERQQAQASLGYEVVDDNYVVLQYQVDQNGNKRLLVGYRLSLW